MPLSGYSQDVQTICFELAPQINQSTNQSYLSYNGIEETSILTKPLK